MTGTCSLHYLELSRETKTSSIYSGAGFEVADVSYIPEKSYSRESDLSSTESIGFEISELEKFKCGNA